MDRSSSQETALEPTHIDDEAATIMAAVYEEPSPFSKEECMGLPVDLLDAEPNVLDLDPK